ncbi:hypothetical protein OAK19_06305 [Aureispira]|nr:hypothetical protein [Aureispira sp.]
MAKNSKKENAGFPKIKISLLSRFQELLKLNINHDYFDSGGFSKVKLIPTDQTSIALTNNGMQCRFVNGGLMLGYTFSDHYTPIKEIKKPVQLSFFLEIDDVNFMNYTDLPYEFEEDKIFYFNNRELEKDSTEYKNLSLDQFVTEEDKIEISSSLINFSFDDEQFGTEVQVVDAAEEVVFETILEDGSMSCEISLLGQPEGKYSLLVDGLEEKTFFLYNGLKTVFGAIDIIIDKDDFGDYAFYDDEGEIVQQEYNIHFKAREVRWKYVLIETGPERLYEEHHIYDTKKGKDYQPVSFEDVEEEEMGGKTVHTIWTENKIPFMQKQNQRFKLKTKRGKSGVEWIVGLPCPSAVNDLKVNLSNESEVYSEIIVYL